MRREPPMNTPLTPRPLTTPVVSEPSRSASGGTSGYAPSAVPMVVHRQILSELEGAKQHIQALTQDNQRLQKQNQDLLVEIDRVVKSVRRLQGLAEHHPLSPQPISPQPPQQKPPTSHRPPDYRDPYPQAHSQPLYNPMGEDDPYPATHPEYPEGTATRLQRDSLQRDTGGWWLILTVLLIVVTAFGTGFLIVRPFLGNSSSPPNETLNGTPNSNPSNP